MFRAGGIQNCVLLRRLAGAAVGICLFVSLWRAPVPCIHMHEEPSESARNDDLTVHLSRFHVETGDDSHGWHVHVVAFRDFFRGGGCPVPDDGEQPNPDEMPIVPSLTDSRVAPVMAVSLLPGCFGETLPTLTADAYGLESGVGQPAENEAFVLTSRRRLPLLCIARC